MPLPRPAPETLRWWVVGILGCGTAAGLIIWWGITTTAGQVRPEVTGYVVESDSSVVVRYDVHRPEGVAVVCQVSALDARKGRVGTVDDTTLAEGAATVSREVRIRTSSRAVTGVVDACTRLPVAP